MEHTTPPIKYKYARIWPFARTKLGFLLLLLIGIRCGVLSGYISVLDVPEPYITLNETIQQGIKIQVTRKGLDFIEAYPNEIAGALFLKNAEGYIEINLCTVLGQPDPCDITQILHIEGLDPLTLELKNPRLTVNLGTISITLEEGAQKIQLAFGEMEIGLAAKLIAAYAETGDVHDVACLISNGLGNNISFILQGALELKNVPAGSTEGRFKILDLSVPQSNIHIEKDCTEPQCTDGETACNDCELFCDLFELGAQLSAMFIGLMDNVLTYLFNTEYNKLLNLDNDGLQRLIRIDSAAVFKDRIDIKEVMDIDLALFSPYDFDIRADSVGMLLDLGAKTEKAVHLPEMPAFEKEYSRPLNQISLKEIAPTEFDLGVTFSRQLLNYLLYTTYQSGALSQSLTAEQIAQLTDQKLKLTSEVINLFFPGINQIFPRGSSLLLTLHPQSAPQILPSSSFSGESSDNSWYILFKQTDFGLLIFLEQAYMTLFRVNLDLEIEITAQTADTTYLLVNSIQFQNLAVEYNQVLPGADVEEILKALIPFALIFTSSQFIDINNLLQDILKETSAQITPVVTDLFLEGENKEALTILLNLSEREVPATPEATIRTIRQSFGQVKLALDLPRLTEAFYRINKTVWTRDYLHIHGNQVEISHPMLKLIGTHELELILTAAGSHYQVTTEIRVSPVPMESQPEKPGLTSLSCHFDITEQKMALDGLFIWIFLLGALFLSRQSRRKKALHILFLFGFVLGCEDNRLEPIDCVTTLNCPKYYACACDGFCTPTIQCGIDRDCCFGQQCISGNCETICECATDSDCPQYSICQEAICVAPPCQTTADCLKADYCLNGSCLSQFPCNGACQEQAACNTAINECVDLASPPACEPGNISLISNAYDQVGFACMDHVPVAVCLDSPDVPVGQYGKYLALGLWGDQILVSAYNETYGDLMLLTYRPDLQLDRLDFIDGIPLEAPIVGKPNGIRHGIIEPGENVGSYSSITLNRFKDRFIVYQHIDKQALQIAYQLSAMETWNHYRMTEETVQSISQLRIDSADRFHLGYITQNGTRLTLKYAYSESMTPLSSLDWSVRSISEMEFPADPIFPAAVYHASSMAITADKTHMAYYDPAQKRLKTASGNVFEGFQTEVIEVAAWSKEDYGLSPAIALAPNGKIGISFQNISTGSLAYCAREDATGWSCETVDSGIYAADTAMTGALSRILFDASGNLILLYYDQTNNTLKMALKRNGEWELSQINTDPVVLPFFDLGLYQQQPLVGYLKLNPFETGQYFVQLKLIE